ncbi:MAG: division/cell wall cluster transcriptional repressor MraZ [Bacteroidota bacterium]
MAFKGQAENTVDSKGRIAIPAKMRNAMNPEAKQTVVLTRGFEKTVFVYPLDEWQEIEAQIAQLNRFQKDARNFSRQLLRWAEEQTLDSQGRVSLTKELMAFASINTSEKALILGNFDHLEIWNKDVFEQAMNEESGSYESLAETVMG